ncbi:hypothetical protein D8770_14265 [Methylobacterium sp. DB1607]|nr:hypothetical protein [Methylobacterium sp. DB1607]
MPGTPRIAETALALMDDHGQYAHRDLPERRLWIETLPHSRELLGEHPVFEGSAVSPHFGAYMLGWERSVLKAIRHEPTGDVQALIWRAEGRRFAPDERDHATTQAAAAYGPYGPLYRRGRDWVGLSRRWVWTAGGGRSDSLIVGFYVQQLAGLDEDGRPIPVPPQGAIPGDDEAALGGLAP